MSFERGDRVIATEALGGILFSKVPKGTEGVVTSVSLFGGTITVDFDNGATESVSERSIAKVN